MSHPDRVLSLVDRLTREEKLSLVHGGLDPDRSATGYLPGVDRLGIPPLRLADGPLGVRVPGKQSTAFPAAISLAATFDPALARRQGEVMAAEARARGQHAVLGPGCNLIRVPHCGRNFEYYSEDPLLTGEFAAGVVTGLQSADVIATPKHYVANNQETGRAVVSAEVSERALRELYLPGFRAAVDAGAGSVMTAYNRVNGTFASDHRRLLTDVLKGEWGFDGYVVSDWFGTASTEAAANAGLDLEMPGLSQAETAVAFSGDPDLDPADVEVDPEEMGVDHDEMDGPWDADSLPTVATHGTQLFGDPLDAAIDRGDVPEARLDDMVARVLGQMDRIGLLDAPTEGGHGREERRGALDAPEHRELAAEIAARGSVLLKNEDATLPLAEDADVAVVGPAAGTAMLGGGGSSEMDPFVETATAEGIAARAGGAVTVVDGIPAIETPSILDAFDDADGGGAEEDGENVGDGNGDGRDGGDGADDPTVDFDAAVDAARAADVAVVVVKDAAGEAFDRPSLALPGRQDELVAAVADAAERTVVVVQSSGPVELPWRADVGAILQSWYPGQADGEAVANVLYGDVDPSGRLPVTFAPEETYPTAGDDRAFPGVDDEVHYDEGVFVGYRHFDAKGLEPAYPFGHGHSYASFEYGDAVVVDETTVRVEVTNVADRAGREVVQAYVRPPAVAGVERPVRELAGFAAVDVPAGQTETVDVDLTERAMARYDETEGWTVDPGQHVVEVGRSSRDVRSEVAIRGENTPAFLD